MQHKATINIGVTVKYADPAKTTEYFCTERARKEDRCLFDKLSTISNVMTFEAIKYLSNPPSEILIPDIGIFKLAADAYAVTYRSDLGIEIVFSYPRLTADAFEVRTDSGNLIKQHNGKTYEQIDTGNIEISCDDCAAQCRDELCCALCRDPFDCPDCTIWQEVKQ